MAWPKGKKRPCPTFRLAADPADAVTLSDIYLIRLKKALGFGDFDEVTPETIAGRAETLRRSLAAAADRELVAMTRPAWP